MVKRGDDVVAGQRIGLIRFGSRVDVYLPAGTSPQVLLGQRTIAGETILARVGVSELIGRRPVIRTTRARPRAASRSGRWCPMR